MGLTIFCTGVFLFHAASPDGGVFGEVPGLVVMAVGVVVMWAKR